MSDEERLDMLLDRWEELEADGHGISAEELCSDCPELLDDLKVRIRRLRTMDEFLNSPNENGRMSQVLPATANLPDRYRTVRLHDHGGLGEVFVAVDTELHRQIALKRIHARFAADAEARRRFLREAEITGRLEHPGVVPVYGLTVDQEGLPCYAMRFIRGQTLREAIDAFHRAGRPQSDWSQRTAEARKLLQSFLTVCQTIAYAHGHGIVHRDLKPANIMLERYGETLVVDWGLAKTFQEKIPLGVAETQAVALTDEDLQRMFHTIGVKGSPAYMSPEQAAGHWDEVGPASDIYSLGATLYVLLTGKTPFDGATLPHVLDKVKRGDFLPPRQLNSSIPAPLEAICLKAMQVEATKRYGSPLDLAADLECWLADEPVSVWTEPWTTRGRRWVRRHRTLMSTAAAAVLVAVVTLTGATLELLDKNSALAKEKGKEQAARIAATRSAGEAKDKADKLAVANDRLTHALYLSGIRLASGELARSDIPEAQRALESCPVGLRGPEWCYLMRLTHGQQQVFPTDTNDHRKLIFSHDGQWFAVLAFGDTVRIVDAHSGRVKHVLHADGSTLADIDFSPNGRWFAAAGNRVWIWNVGSGRLAHTLEASGRFAQAVTFSDDSKQVLGATPPGLFALPPLLAGLQPAGITCWDVESGRLLRTVSGDFAESVDRTVFSPDGTQVAWIEGLMDPTGHLPNRIQIWETASGKTVCTIEKDRLGAVRAAAFSSDGKLLATARQDGTVSLWNTADGKELRTLYGHVDEVRAIAFQPGGRWMATAGKDRGIRLWSVATGRNVATLRGHAKPVNTLAFSPDGTRLASAGGEKSVSLWAIKTPGAHIYRESGQFVSSLAVSPDGLGFATGGAGVQVWETPSGKELFTLPRRLLPWLSRDEDVAYAVVAYRPDGKRIAIGGKDVRLCDARDGSPIRSFAFPVSDLLYSPDGRWLLTIQQKEKKAILRNAETGTQVATFPQADDLMAAAFSPDGAMLATGSRDKTIVLWNLKDRQKLRTLRTGEKKGTGSELNRRLGGNEPSSEVPVPISSQALRGHGSWIADLAFSPDSQRLASASNDETVRVWDVASGESMHILTGHTDSVASVAFSHDGMRLASAGRDRTIKLWDVASGELLLTLGRDGGGHVEWIHRVAFAAGDKYLISAGGSFAISEILIWDMRPLE